MFAHAKKKALAVIGIAAAASCVFMASAQAGGTYEHFSTTVGKVAGNGYTGYQTKSISSADGQLTSMVVGGNYTLYGSLQAEDGNGSGGRVSDIGDGGTYQLPNSIAAGHKARVHFKTSRLIPVDVQAEGQWRSQ